MNSTNRTGNSRSNPTPEANPAGLDGTIPVDKGLRARDWGGILVTFIAAMIVLFAGTPTFLGNHNPCEDCCDDHSKPGQGEVCCEKPDGETTATPVDDCCDGRIPDEGEECCDDEVIDLETHGCCKELDGEGQVLSENKFDLENERCCEDGEVIPKNPQFADPQDDSQGVIELNELSDRLVQEIEVWTTGNLMTGFLHNYYDYMAIETERKTERKIEKLNEDPDCASCGADKSMLSYPESNLSYSFDAGFTHSGVSINFTINYTPAAHFHSIPGVSNPGNYEKICQLRFVTLKRGKSSRMIDQSIVHDQYHNNNPYPSKSGNHVHGPHTTWYNDETVFHDSTWAATNYHGTVDWIPCCPGE